MNLNELQLLHIQAGKELRTFRNSIKHAENMEERADDLAHKAYCLNQADAYRKAAAECMERYQGLMEQILSLTNSFLLWPA